ncbi:MAG: hypothetical protein GY851_13900 [bacterium]|nr:hypothetical protein [bacterium]
MKQPHAPGKWTGVQILAHVADGDMVCYTRVIQAIVEPSDVLFSIPTDGELWMEELACDSRPVEVSLAGINGARLWMIHTLRTLPKDVLLRTLKHEEMGEVTPFRYAEIAAEHGAHHLAQLEALAGGEC